MKVQVAPIFLFLFAFFGIRRTLCDLTEDLDMFEITALLTEAPGRNVPNRQFISSESARSTFIWRKWIPRLLPLTV